MKQVVAIDGPSGSGKSTVAAILAKELGYVHLDTGAMYRAVALAAAKERIGFDDRAGLDALCARIKIELRPNREGISVFLDGTDVTEEIRSPEMSLGSSAVSSVPEVRKHMVELQRQIGQGGGVVAEGRDMGTVVFPGTSAKFYLDATPEERSKRRWLQLKKMGSVEDLEKVHREMIHRDLKDSLREHSPLQKADDAVVIDTTGMTVEQVLEKMVKMVKDLEKSGA